MTAATMAGASGGSGARRLRSRYDQPLLLTAAAILILGLLMVGSASVAIADRQLGDSSYYLIRQCVFAGAGLFLGWLVLRVPLHVWERSGPILLVGALVLLALVLVPGLGRTVNGGTRWLMLGPFNFQVSELAKLAVVVYLAGYLVRHGEAVRTRVDGFLKPMVLIGGFALLLLSEPDFGATVVLLAIALGMMFLGGVRLWLFGLLLFGAGGALAVLAISSPYRMERLTSFLEPWAQAQDGGYQLTQALIAFGRGNWSGVGLGGSVQKLFYLPEAHTDFILAVLGEELGLLGVALVVGLFTFLIWRIFHIGRRAAEAGLGFGSHVAFGVAIWLGFQAFVNMGVNMGLLPTKGLTLPLMSYGGSSMVATCLALALVLRVAFELREADYGRRVDR
jgi:cell division protein FtsW